MNECALGNHLFCARFAKAVMLLTFSGISCVAQLGSGPTPTETSGPTPTSGSTPTGTVGGAGPIATGIGPGIVNVGPVSSEPAPYRCVATEASETVLLRRLTKYEYRNSVRALLSTPADQSAKVAETPLLDLAPLEELLVSLPDDRPMNHQKLFDGSDLRTNESHVLSHFQIGKWVGEQVAVNASLYEKLVGAPCSAAPQDKSSCAGALLESLGTRVFRRPLSPGEKTLYLDRYRGAAISSHKDGIRVLVTALLNAPAFIFHVEDQGELTTSGGDQLALTPFEMASRLSYALTGSMPDRTLLDAALAGKLQDRASFDAQVERILASPAARAHVRRFFTQWLKIPESGDLSTLHVDYLAGINPVGLLPKLAQETHEFIDHVVWNRLGGLDELFLSRDALITDADVAAIYKVTPGSASKPLVELNGTHAGLLTRAALLLGMSVSTSPIARGVRTRRQILCDPLPDPVDTTVADTELKPLGDETLLSTRQIFEHRTSLPRCQSCHTMINGLGFAFEGYDNLGRSRTKEVKYSATGERLATIPVNTVTTPMVLTEGAESSSISQDAVQLSTMIGSTKKAHACLIDRWVEYTVGSIPAVPGTSCFRERLYGALAKEDSGSVADMFRQTAGEIFATKKPL